MEHMGSKAIIHKQMADLASTDEQTAFRAVRELKRTGKEALPALLTALQEPGSLRTMAIVVLGELGKEAETAVPMLCELLFEEHEETQMASALSLTRIGVSVIQPLLKVIERDGEAGAASFWASWAVAMTDPYQVTPAIAAIMNREREHSSSLFIPFAAEEALGKVIAAQLDRREDPQ